MLFLLVIALILISLLTVRKEFERESSNSFHTFEPTNKRKNINFTKQFGFVNQLPDYTSGFT